MIQKDRIYAVSNKGVTLVDSLLKHFCIGLHHVNATCHLLLGTNFKNLAQHIFILLIFKVASYVK